MDDNTKGKPRAYKSLNASESIDLKSFVANLKAVTTESNGHDVAANLTEQQNQCPVCGKVYTFSKPRGQGSDWEREQHLSGICSDACWNAGLGV